MTGFPRDGIQGWLFTAEEAISVSSLGYYDYNQDGFVDSHEIGLWELGPFGSATLLVTTTLSVGTASELDGNFRYNSITPINLTPGKEYAIGGVIGVGSGLANFDYTVRPTNSGWSSISQISGVHGVIGFVDPAGTGLNNSNWPQESATSTDPPNLGANFRIGSAAVPEPGSLIILTVVFALAIGRRFRNGSMQSLFQRSSLSL